MSNFPKLIPAFTCLIVLDTPLSIGAVAGSGPLSLAPFKPNAGSLKSEPDYPIKVDAHFIHGSDYIRQDTSQKLVRLDVHSVLKDKGGSLIKYSYSGVIDLTPASAAVLGGKPDAKTTDFGDAVTHVTFETASEELKDMGDKVYVASGRFIVEPGKNLTVEYKISQVTA